MKQLLQQALDALIDSVDDCRNALGLHIAEWGENWPPASIAAMRKTIADGDAAIAALETELAKPDTRSFGEVHPHNPNAKCQCEHWQFCAECHPTKPIEETHNCSRHPDAPHGFDRNGSHASGRYVC